MPTQPIVLRWPAMLSLPVFHHGWYVGGSDAVYRTRPSNRRTAEMPAMLCNIVICLLGTTMICCADFDIAISNAELLEILCKHYVLAKQLVSRIC